MRTAGTAESGRCALLRVAWLMVLVLCAGAPASLAQDQRPRVHVVPISGIIDLGLAPFVSRALDEAAESGAAAVILDINTFGGRVDAAVLIRDALLQARVPTVAFVNRRAISAGALISLAAEKIAMATGATIGAATPVEIGGPGGGARPVAEKTVSYVRKEFRSTAEARGRPPLLAEAMVDADVEIPGLSEKGKLLTLTVDEAIEHRLIDFRADSLAAVLAALGLQGAELQHAHETWAESLVRFLTHPIVSSLLMMVGILGILTEIRTPGFGVPGAVGIAGVSLFLWGHWLVQLAGWEELLLIFGGFLLLAIEMFVTPGFGVTGILGIGAVIAGFGLSLVGAGATWEVMVRAALQVVVSLLLAIGAAAALLRWLPRASFGRRLILEDELPSGAGYASPPAGDQAWLGKRGVSATPLHPAGVAEIDGERVDVVSDGAFIDAGEAVEVSRVDGNRIVVRRHRASR